MRNEKLTVSRLLIPAICLLSFAGVSFAEVGDVTLRTDHPDYPGEGALQTPLDCVRHATREGQSDHERALAVFHWLLTHQWHLMSPQEWCQPGRIPGADTADYEMVVYDANRGRFSYGYGLCGTVHAWNEVYWQAAGFRARRRAFPGHSNSEVFVDGRWRMYDTDMAGIVFNRDGTVAGYDEIIRDLSLLDDAGNQPKYPFAWPSDFDGMKAGWKEVARGGHWYKLYHGGYAAHPAIVHLRSGESFTRYAHPDGFGGPEKRRFWHQQPGGPSRLWTFANNGEPFHRGPDSNSRGRTRYGNAVFEYSPDLKSDSLFEGVAKRSANLQRTAIGLHSSDAQSAEVTFEHFSPYVICGDPVDDADPMRGAATDGLIVEGQTSGGPVSITVSSDQGQTWNKLTTVRDSFRIDLTDFVKGHYGWWLSFKLPTTSVLSSLRCSTTCQLCETIYPRLKPGGSVVTAASRQRAVVPILPQLADEKSTSDRYEQRSLRSSNLRFVGRSASERLAYQVMDHKEASVVFRVPSATPLISLAAAARYAVRSPSPKGAAFRLDFSADNGETWTEFAASIPPEDNEYSSGWVYGSTDIAPVTATEALVRVRVFGGGASTGLLAAELYGVRQTARPSEMSVTYGWFEGNQHREHAFIVPADTADFSATIPTGAMVRDDFVRITVGQSGLHAKAK